jgi:hypothetical protein
MGVLGDEMASTGTEDIESHVEDDHRPLKSLIKNITAKVIKFPVAKQFAIAA